MKVLTPFWILLFFFFFFTVNDFKFFLNVEWMNKQMEISKWVNKVNAC